MKKYIGTHKISIMSLAFLLSVWPITKAVGTEEKEKNVTASQNFYTTGQIRAEVGRELGKFRQNMEEYYERTRAKKRAVVLAPPVTPDEGKQKADSGIGKSLQAAKEKKKEAISNEEAIKEAEAKVKKAKEELEAARNHTRAISDTDEMRKHHENVFLPAQRAFEEAEEGLQLLRNQDAEKKRETAPAEVQTMTTTTPTDMAEEEPKEERDVDWDAFNTAFRAAGKEVEMAQKSYDALNAEIEGYVEKNRPDSRFFSMGEEALGAENMDKIRNLTQQGKFKKVDDILEQISNSEARLAVRKNIEIEKYYSEHEEEIRKAHERLQQARRKLEPLENQVKAWQARQLLNGF